LEVTVLRDSLKPRIEEASASKSYGPEILHGLIEKESTYRPDAVSETGVRGLCQLTEATAKEVIQKHGLKMPISAILKPENQVLLASLRLEEMIGRVEARYPKLSEEKQLELALHAYNAGYSAVTTAVSKGGIKGFKQFLPKTADKKYAMKVMFHSKSWKVGKVQTQVPTPRITIAPEFYHFLPFLTFLFLVFYFAKKYQTTGIFEVESWDLKQDVLKTL
jgi:hypothetical protein